MELAKAYDPKAVEDKWYETWLERGYFRATPGDSQQGTPYCITIPPPNITGSLHMGHALNNSIIDAMTRWHRMRGDNTVTVPGTDHAGIATQNVVERELAREGKTRFDLGREAFIERCWQWRREYGDRIYQQFHKLGCSYDWSRARFTMDESYVAAIHEEFIRWWDRGLIYRGARVVNWCPRCASAISDIEVNSEERAGKLYHIRYPFAEPTDEGRTGRQGDKDAGRQAAAAAQPSTLNPQPSTATSITIATTRPETMLGDTAVAVNPADPRYAGLVGRTLRLPLTDREIPLIADEYAKMEFGTGAVKVTPAHDLDDFEAGLRNNLPQLVVIGEDGSMTEAAGPRYAGLDRFEARQRVLEDLEAQCLLERVEDYTIQTPLCDRCGTVIEPLLSEQWFADQRELARPAIEAVNEGKIRFIPDRYTRIYLDWMERIQPWCISRQLWWGHRIPVWWTADGKYAAARNVDEAARKLGVPAADLRQDEDVLDTWFSSALWPHAVLGWPAQTEDLAFWYPTNLLSTAQEILYLWVARMIMTGLDFIHRPADAAPDSVSLPPAGGTRAVIPFRDVYIHATVLDAQGARMSKSKGNGVDPLEMIDRYGADALRFYLLQNAGKNQDIKFREDAVRLAGTFCNKLWNASRFVLLSLESRVESRESGEAGHSRLSTLDSRLSTADRWILSRLNRTIETVNGSLATYDMDDAMRAIYHFLWDDFCDWYLELAKPRLRIEGEDKATVQAVLYHTLETALRLMHPMAPFITEEIWQTLTSRESRVESRESAATLDSRLSTLDSILFAPYPQADAALINPAAEEKMELVIEAVRALRNLRAESGLPAGQKAAGAVVAGSRGAAVTLSDNSDLIAFLARLSDVEHRDAPPQGPEGEGRWLSAAIPGAEVFLDIAGAEQAVDVEKERERVERELATVEKELVGVSGRLANPQFTERAPAAVVEKARAQAAELEERRAKLLARRAALG